MGRDLDKLKDILAKDARPVSQAQRERQIVSLAYGNLKLEHERLTRAAVADAREPASKKP